MGHRICVKDDHGHGSRLPTVVVKSCKFRNRLVESPGGQYSVIHEREYAEDLHRGVQTDSFAFRP